MNLIKLEAGNKNQVPLGRFLWMPERIQTTSTPQPLQWPHVASAARWLLGYFFTWILLEDPWQ